MTSNSSQRALVLAPLRPPQLEVPRQDLEMSYESWLDTRRLYDPSELASRLRDEEFAVLLVEADFVTEEVFEGAPSLRFVGICRNATS